MAESRKNLPKDVSRRASFTLALARANSRALDEINFEMSLKLRIVERTGGLLSSGDGTIEGRINWVNVAVELLVNLGKFYLSSENKETCGS